MNVTIEQYASQLKAQRNAALDEASMLGAQVLALQEQNTKLRAALDEVSAKLIALEPKKRGPKKKEPADPIPNAAGASHQEAALN